jgi:apolipoprotein N-acyltransferase
VTSRGAQPSRSAAVRVVARGLIIPLVAGALCVLGFAPFYWWPVPVLGVAVLMHAWGHSGSPLQASLTGFAFGLGYYLAGIPWIYVSLHVYGQMPAVFAAIATFLLCAYMALFPAAAGWIAQRFVGDPRWRALAAAPAAFVALEWTRSWLFTGFPWLTLGTSQAPGGPLAGFAPIVGGYGVSLAVAIAAALAAALVRSAPWSRQRALLAGGLVVLFLAGGALRLIEWTAPAGPPIRVALLQGNVAQDLKFRDDTRARTLADYRAMILAANARVVVLPETALPAFLDRLPPGYVDELRAHAVQAHKEILMGALERRFSGERYEYFNSVVSLGEGASQSFRKRHLVPFGEFIPPGFRWVLAIFKIPLTDFARGDAGQPPLRAAGIPIAVTVCYEDIFGEELIEQLPEAQLLLNVSNTAWFGESFASDQHLQSSQLRSIETGRWSVRATNTGVTAAVNERGRVVARLPQFSAGTLVTDVTPFQGTTPYVRWGNGAAIALFAGLLALAAGRGRRARP